MNKHGRLSPSSCLTMIQTLQRMRRPTAGRRQSVGKHPAHRRPRPELPGHHEGWPALQTYAAQVRIWFIIHFISEVIERAYSSLVKVLTFAIHRRLLKSKTNGCRNNPSRTARFCDRLLRQ